MAEDKKLDKVRFMEDLQQYKCLYDKFSREFKDKYKKMNCRAALGEKHKIGHTTQTLGEKHTTHGYGRFQKYKDGLRMIFEAQKKPPVRVRAS